MKWVRLFGKAGRLLVCGLGAAGNPAFPTGRASEGPVVGEMMPFTSPENTKTVTTTKAIAPQLRTETRNPHPPE